jgi:hypothetical protein
MDTSRYRFKTLVVLPMVPVACALFLLLGYSAAGADSPNATPQTGPAAAQDALASTATSGQTGAASTSTNTVGTSPVTVKDTLGKFSESVRKLNATKLNLSIPLETAGKPGNTMGTPRSHVPAVQRKQISEPVTPVHDDSADSDSSWANRSNESTRDRGLSSTMNARGTMGGSSGSTSKTSAPRASQPATSGGWKK